MTFLQLTETVHQSTVNQSQIITQLRSLLKLTPWLWMFPKSGSIERSILGTVRVFFFLKKGGLFATGRQPFLLKI